MCNRWGRGLSGHQAGQALQQQPAAADHPAAAEGVRLGRAQPAAPWTTKHTDSRSNTTNNPRNNNCRTRPDVAAHRHSEGLQLPEQQPWGTGFPPWLPPADSRSDPTGSPAAVDTTSTPEAVQQLEEQNSGLWLLSPVDWFTCELVGWWASAVAAVLGGCCWCGVGRA